MSRAMPSARAASLRPQPPAAFSQSGIPIAEDVNLTAIMERENIAKIERYPAGRFSVVLMDRRIGVGGSVGEALERAKQ